jgi:hypothetical protein
MHLNGTTPSTSPFDMHRFMVIELIDGEASMRGPFRHHDAMP